MANVNGTYHKLQYLERKPHQPKPQVYMRVSYPGRIGIWRCWFLLRENNRTTREKKPWNKARTNNKFNPHMAPGRNRTRATFVGGERSHHYAIPLTNRFLRVNGKQPLRKKTKIAGRLRGQTQTTTRHNNKC